MSDWSAIATGVGSGIVTVGLSGAGILIKHRLDRRAKTQDRRTAAAERANARLRADCMDAMHRNSSHMVWLVSYERNRDSADTNTLANIEAGWHLFEKVEVLIGRTEGLRIQPTLVREIELMIAADLLETKLRTEELDHVRQQTEALKAVNTREEYLTNQRAEADHRYPLSDEARRLQVALSINHREMQADMDALGWPTYEVPDE